MNVKISFSVGVDAAGKLHPLYLGTDGEAAKAAYTAAVNGGTPGIETVYLFIRPRQDRRHDVVKRSQHAAPSSPPESAGATTETVSTSAEAIVADAGALEAAPAEPAKPAAKKKK